MQDSFVAMGPSHASTSAVVDATPQQVLETSGRWGARLGLDNESFGDDAVTFCLSLFPELLRGFELQVLVSQHEGGATHAVFTASVEGANQARFDDLKRMARTFAVNVCSDLAGQGSTVVPRELGWASPHSKLLWKYGRGPRLAYIALWIVLLPAIAASAIFSKDHSTAPVLTGYWLVLLIYASDVGRLRVLGARASLMFSIAVAGSVFGLILTLIMLVS